jgi:hypothetical protein
MPLPTAPVQNVLSPERLRAIIYGRPGAGKTTLAAGWYPKSNLIIDVEGGTRFLTGEHYVVRPASYSEFQQLIVELVTTRHQYQTVTIDTIDSLIRMADAQAGQRYGKVAAGLAEFGKGLADRDGTVLRDLGRLLATDLGVILTAHHADVTVQTDEGAEAERVFPRVDQNDRLRQPVMGLVDFIVAVHRGTDETRALITGASPVYETKRRVHLPDLMASDAAGLYAAVKAGIESLNTKESK